MITKESAKGNSLYTLERVLESWSEWTEECERRADKILENNLGAKEASCHLEGREDWAGTKNWEETLKLARYGWPEGLGLMMKMRQDLGVVFGSMVKRSRMKNDWIGGTVSVARWMGNRPKIFRRRVQRFEVGTGRVMDIIVDWSASWNVDRERLMRRGASILLLIDALETAGISCQVELRIRVEEYPKISYCVRTPIKKAGEQLDMDMMAFAMVHPSILRRMFFAMLGGEEDKFFVEYGYGNKNRSGGYGVPVERADAEYREKEDIVIPDANDSDPWDDLHKCAEWVRKNLNECGVKHEQKDIA